MINWFKNVLRRFRDFLLAPISQSIVELHDLVLAEQSETLRNRHANPLNRAGFKVFSQTDEDGISLEILRRIGITGAGSYAEFGVGDGLENNTLVLAARGFRGFWVGGQKLAFDSVDNERFTYIRAWITLENIVSLARRGLESIDIQSLDVLSLDLDGNDLYFAGALLDAGIRPKLFIAEYNAKFPPPIEFSIDYDAGHIWKQDDYMGASLASLVKLFDAHGYRLVCCNSHSGANAFFIDRQYAAAFVDVPERIEELYVPPRYHLFKSYGHARSPRTAALILRSSRKG